MADNFNLKQFLAENKLGAYSRIKENSLTEARKPDFIIPANDAYDLDEEAENFENILNNADIMAKCKAGIGEVEVYLTDKTDLAQAKQVLEDEGYQVGYNEIDEAKEKSNKQKLIDAGYSESDAEDFADEFEQGGSKVPQKVKDILTGKEEEVFGGINEKGMFATKANINPELVDKVERFVKGVSKAYGYSIDDAYTNIMSVLKSGLSKKEESLNEMLEPHVYERMYNLSNIKAQQAMIKAAEILMNDLTAEGFEVPEIREFFTQLIANDI